VEPREAIREAYATGKGGFRVRARWRVEDAGRGMWRIIVTEVPYQVSKGKLVEKLAELVDLKKAPLLGDVRDESAEDVRLVLEPRARNVDPEQLMESLFRLSDLESRISLNLNVLDRFGAPRVMSLVECLSAFNDHKRDVICARARWRLAKIEARLEILAGLLIAFLNLDEVIRIIRYEDDPKGQLMATFALTANQANAILDTRLRNLRQLEEMELRQEDTDLKAEKAELERLLASERLQWKQVGEELREVRSLFGPDTAIGRRRTTFAEAAPAATVLSADAFVVREPITVVLSHKGWIRALKGKVDDLSGLKFKEGDALLLSLPAETTDKITLVASDGRSFSLAGDKLPGGRGLGEPVRLSIDLSEEHAIITMFVAKEGAERVVASSAGYGFVVAEDEFVATKRGGKQVLNPDGGARLLICQPLAGDRIATVGDNRKLLVFEASELPRMARGKGVKLQAFKDGGLADLTAFNAADGLTWTDSAGRRREVPDWDQYLGKRATAGRMVPKGFSKTGRFTG
jgi:topoisomerase-4 subunit A